MSHFCKHFGIGRRLVSSNPFQGAGIGIYGLNGKHWLEYSDEDLDKIFEYSWEAQEKLLLELALSTGMRLNEIASLTWERIMSTNRYDYVTLKDRFDLPNQTVKNEGSKRDIPLHPSFRRPEKATGRIFDYAIDSYGYATTSAGRAVNSTLRELIPNPQKSFHSFRSTFIIKLTETGCDTFTNRAIAGHGGRNANESVYNAVKNDTRFEAIEKLRLEPWLNRCTKRLNLKQQRRTKMGKLIATLALALAIPTMGVALGEGRYQMMGLDINMNQPKVDKSFLVLDTKSGMVRICTADFANFSSPIECGTETDTQIPTLSKQ